MPTLASKLEITDLPTETAAFRVGPSSVSRPGFRIVLLLVPVLAFFFFWQFFPRTDPDYWWHVRAGQVIFDAGKVPRVDSFSFTASGQRWVAHEWMTEVLFYITYKRAGYAGNVALFGLVAAATGLAIYATCRTRGVSELVAIVLTIWAVYMSPVSSSVRPQALTTLLLSITALLLTHYKKDNVLVLAALPPLLALWVNLHGGFVIGLALLWLTLIGELLTRGWRRPIALLAMAAALSTAATLLNPSGVEALTYPFTYAGTGNASMRYISEWQSPDFHQPLFLVFAASLLVATLVGVGRRPLGLTEALWLLTFAAMALQSVRHIPLYAVIVTPLLGARLQYEVPTLGPSTATLRRPLVLVLVWTILIVSFGSSLAFADKRSALQLGWEPSEAGLPAGAVDYLRTHELAGNLFNEYNWGGYLIHRLYPDRRVFIDGRADVYGDALVESYVTIARLRPGWREALDRYDVRLVLVEKDSPLAMVLSVDAGWQLMYEGQVERLFYRQAPST